MRRARDIDGRAHGGAKGLDRLFRGKARQNEGGGGLGARQHLEGEFGHDRKGSKRAGEPAREIIAGDVLDHGPARLEGFAAAVDALDAKDVVARGAGLDAARAGQIGHEAAAK